MQVLRSAQFVTGFRRFSSKILSTHSGKKARMRPTTTSLWAISAALSLETVPMLNKKRRKKCITILHRYLCFSSCSLWLVTFRPFRSETTEFEVKINCAAACNDWRPKKKKKKKKKSCQNSIWSVNSIGFLWVPELKATCLRSTLSWLTLQLIYTLSENF